MVDHGCDDQVDVDPDGVVQHKPNKGQDREDIGDRQICWQLHFQLRIEKFLMLDDSWLILGIAFNIYLRIQILCIFYPDG